MMDFNMPCFVVQKTVFWTLKGHLLQAKRRPFAKPLIVRHLRADLNTCRKGCQSAMF